MADYQDFEVKVTKSTSLLPELTGKLYYVVGATNEKHGSVSYVYNESGVLFGIPLSGVVSIPGQGIPCKRIRANAADTWVFYYIK